MAKIFLALLGKRVHDVKVIRGERNDKAKALNKGKQSSGKTGLGDPAKPGRKAYERELATLHGELVKLQSWVVACPYKFVPELTW